MFDIGFLDGEPPYVGDLDEEGWWGLWGEIVLGDIAERFVAPVGAWSKGDYERQWIEGAQRLVGGAGQSAFVEESGRIWWIAWRETDLVYLQQRWLIDESMARAWSAGASDMPYELVGQRASHNEDGEELSTWVVAIRDIHDFLNRKLQSSNPADAPLPPASGGNIG